MQVGLCLTHLTRRSANLCFVCQGDNLENVIERMYNAFMMRKSQSDENASESSKEILAFSFAIDATKVPKLKEISYEHRAIIGGPSPTHLISLEGKCKAEVMAITKDETTYVNENKEKVRIDKMPNADEVKACIMVLQKSPEGSSPVVLVSALPQSNNESNQFIVDMESCAAKAMEKAGISSLSFTGFAVDGVSVESK